MTINDTLTGEQMLGMLDEENITYLTNGDHDCNGQMLPNNATLDELFYDLDNWFISSKNLDKWYKEYGTEFYTVCFQKASYPNGKSQWEAMLYDKDMNEAWLEDLEHGGKMNYDK